ncbi:isocitrate lyase/PEP mutase family protein [Bradyrhizobium ganzhouense]|uniref:isocitrate lyase/PEP mutase family protein n=1 Tax=Bradyrhizobium ganzhouense TaxID=1179767 RepID=UPI003CEAB094
MKTTARLRQLLAGTDIVIAPGAYDGMTAKLVEASGYPAVYMTGAGTAATLGYPDFGLLTMTEMVSNATTLARSVAIPVIADADTGYGNELNVTRTVREYEASGVAGIHIEDQVAPKRCGHLDGKEIIVIDEYLAKVRAAVAARRDPDFVIIARTDARAVAGFDEAIRRANAAMKAGADMAFVEAVETMEELQAVPQRVNGPCLLNVVRGGKTPEIDFAAAKAMGYRLAILPSLLLVAVAEASMAALRSVKESNAPPSAAGSLPVSERFRRLGSDEWIALATRFRDSADQAAE